MAEKRMFAKKITESDAFLDMPLSAQALYFHLNMNADDDGFVNNPRRIQRYIGAADDDLKLLLAKGFIIAFETGIIVVTHWKVHNTIQSDRYHETDYLEEKGLLMLENKRVYRLNPDCVQNVSILDTKRKQSGNALEPQIRLDKSRLDKSSIDNTTYCAEPSKKASTPTTKIVYADVEAVILNDGSDWKPTQEMYEEYCRLYPGVDVKREFAKMRGWCSGNPAKRKTLAGVKRFVNTWLSREQDKGRRPVAQAQGEDRRYMTSSAAMRPDDWNPFEGVEDYIAEGGTGA